MTGKSPPPLSLALTNLRDVAGWTQQQLAEQTGYSPSAISSWERGDPPPTRQRVDELAQVMGHSPLRVELAVVVAILSCLELPLARSVVEPTGDQLCSVAKAAAIAIHDFAEFQIDLLMAEVREENAQRAREEAEVLWKRLKPQSTSSRESLVERDAGFHRWALCPILCDESASKAADDAVTARKLAEMARTIARQIRRTEEGEEGFLTRLEGLAEAFVANALRVSGELDAAHTAFLRAWSLWHAGSDEAHLLSEARMMDLEASLRRAQRRFEQALRLHAQALERARPGEQGAFLVNMSVTLEVSGDSTGALLALDKAAPLIDRNTHPRLWWVLRYSQALNLVRLGRTPEAVPIVTEVRNLSEQLRNSLDLVRTLFLAGMVDAGLGRTLDAIARLEQVCRDFEHRGYPYDFALVGLDLALLYRQEARWADIRMLADRIVAIFKERKIHRETIAAAILFQGAAARDVVTSELVHRLQRYLRQAQAAPGLRFEQ